MILVLVSIHASCMSHPDVRIFTSMVVITPKFVRGQLLCKPDSRADVLLCVSSDVRSSHVVALCRMFNIRVAVPVGITSFFV
jgi:hypothetical protein